MADLGRNAVDERMHEAMEAHYAALPRDGGFSARCEMILPDDLAGKRVLDLGCRGGKGAYKIADAVGSEGFVLGVDPSAALVERACSRAADRDAALERSARMAFAQGFFEDLRAAGVDDASFDVAIVNSVLNLAWNREAALHEIARVLAPGGFLFHAGVFARRSVDPSEGEGLDRVFASALDEESFERLVAQAGLGPCRFESREPVVADCLPVEAGGEPLFFAAVVHVGKPSRPIID